MADTVRCVDGLVLRRNRNIMHENLVIALQCDMESHKQVGVVQLNDSLN